MCTGCVYIPVYSGRLYGTFLETVYYSQTCYSQKYCDLIGGNVIVHTCVWCAVCLPFPVVTVPEVVYSCHKCVHVSTFSVMYASFDIIFWNLVFVLCTYVHICVYCRAGPFMNGSKLELVSP